MKRTLLAIALALGTLPMLSFGAPAPKTATKAKTHHTKHHKHKKGTAAKSTKK